MIERATNSSKVAVTQKKKSHHEIYFYSFTDMCRFVLTPCSTQQWYYFTCFSCSKRSVWNIYSYILEIFIYVYARESFVLFVEFSKRWRWVFLFCLFFVCPFSFRCVKIVWLYYILIWEEFFFCFFSLLVLLSFTTSSTSSSFCHKTFPETCLELFHMKLKHFSSFFSRDAWCTFHVTVISLFLFFFVREYRQVV